MSHTLDTAPSFLAALDAAVGRHAMLSHPFYQAWTEGRLSQDVLRSYARQYFAHVKAFPTYVSATHATCEDMALRQELLENLIEEERGPQNHPELWLRFAEGLGDDRAEVLAADLLPETRASVDTFRRLTRSGDTLAGLAALYAYESQIPEVAATKRDGLERFYDLDDARAVSFFTVHEAADVYHRQTERDALSRLAVTEADRARAVAAAEEAAQALWTFLDGVARAYAPEASC